MTEVIMNNETIAMADIMADNVLGIQEEIIVADMIGMAMSANQMRDVRALDSMGFKCFIYRKKKEII